MSRVHQIELRCEVDPRSASIRGEMTTRRGRPLPFSGWTEFASVLISLTSGSGGPSGEAGDDGETRTQPRQEN